MTQRIDPQDMDAIGDMMKAEVAPIQVAVARIDERLKNEDEKWTDHKDVHEKNDTKMEKINKKATVGVRILWSVTAISSFICLIWSIRFLIT